MKLNKILDLGISVIFIILCIVLSKVPIISENKEFFLIDFKIYKEDLQPYLPSFDYLMIKYWDTYIYIWFLIICTAISVILIARKEPIVVTMIFTHQLISRIYCGNIDPLIFLIVIVCTQYNNDYMRGILLAFVCFKPSVILIIPYFIYKVKKKFVFLVIFCISFAVFNWAFFFEDMFLFLNRNATMYEDIRIYILRPWFIYAYYRLIREWLTNYHNQLYGIIKD